MSAAERADHSTKRPGRVGVCQTRAQVAPILKRNPVQAALRSLTVAEAVHVGPDSANGCELWISQPRSKCLTFPRKPYGTLLYFRFRTFQSSPGCVPVNISDASERCTLPISNEQSLSDTPRAPSFLQLVVNLLLLLSVMIGAQIRDFVCLHTEYPF
jgi:hypothetical protein